MKIKKRYFFILCCFILFSCGRNQSKKINNLIDSDIVIGNVQDSLLVYSTWKKEIIIENINTHNIIFSKSLLDISLINPVLQNQYVYFKESDTEFQCVNYQNRTTKWSINTDNTIKNFIILNDSIGLLNVQSEGIIGIRLTDGNELYQINNWNENNNCNLPDLSPYPIIKNDSLFYVNNIACSNIKAYEIKNGTVVWSKTLDDGLSVSILMNDNKIFMGSTFGYQFGKIYILSGETGEILEEYSTEIDERCTPIKWKDKVIFYNYKEKQLEEYNQSTSRFNIIKKFNESNDITGQMHLINQYIYYQNTNFEIMKIDLSSYEDFLVKSSNKGGITLVYWDSINQKEVIR